MNRDKTLGLLLAAACFASGLWQTTAQELTEPETLEIRYALASNPGNYYTIPVDADVEVLSFRDGISITSLTLPAGLSRLRTLHLRRNLGLRSLTLPKGIASLETLDLSDNGYLTSLTFPEDLSSLETLDLSGNRLDSRLTLPKGLVNLAILDLSSNDPLTTLKLPEDMVKNVEGGVELRSSITGLSVHYKMKEFSLPYWARVENGGSEISTRLIFPSAQELIRNRVPDSDGVVRIRASSRRILYDDGVHLGRDGVYRINFSGRALLIEVHGVPTRISMNRKDDGVEIVWDRGQLQSAPSIDGPWTDITFDDTRRLFIRSSSPAEFFRVKPD